MPAHSTARAPLPVIVALLVLAAGCRPRDDPRPCPARHARDDARALAVFTRLRASDEGRGLLAATPAPPVCFGEPALNAVTTDGVLLLDARDGADEAAARVGHLLAHLAAGLGEPRPGDAGCEAAVSASLRSEARALAIELRLRRDLGVTRPRVALSFEGAFWGAAPADREGLILDELRAHPDGAPGMDALASGYLRRCRAAEQGP
jgi:hypothetical protein